MCAFFRTLPHTAQVFVQIVCSERLAVLANVGQIADSVVLLGFFYQRYSFPLSLTLALSLRERE